MPHKLHHGFHVNHLVMIALEDLGSRRTLITKPRTKLLITCPKTTHVVNIWKVPGRKKLQLLNSFFYVGIIIQSL